MPTEAVVELEREFLHSFGSSRHSVGSNHAASLWCETTSHVHTR
jgi:hypothetical protein